MKASLNARHIVCGRRPERFRFLLPNRRSEAVPERAESARGSRASATGGRAIADGDGAGAMGSPAEAIDYASRTPGKQGRPVRRVPWSTLRSPRLQTLTDGGIHPSHGESSRSNPYGRGVYTRAGAREWFRLRVTDFLFPSSLGVPDEPFHSPSRRR